MVQGAVGVLFPLFSTRCHQKSNDIGNIILLKGKKKYITLSNERLLYGRIDKVNTNSLIRIYFKKYIQWNPVTTVSKGPKKIGHNNEVTVLTKVSLQEQNTEMDVFAGPPKKSGRNKKVTELTRWP